jgi:hypothetical protein
LARPVGVEQAIAHRDGDLIHVANLREELFGDATETQERAFLGKRSAVTHAELLRSNLAGEIQDFFTGAAGEGATIRDARLIPTLLGKPQPPDVFDSVERDSARHGVPSTEVVDRAMSGGASVGDIGNS